VFTFDVDKHEYRLDGRVLPSVTQIVKSAGLIDTRWYTEEGANRGQNVALITELDDRGVLDESKMPEGYCGYLDAWRQFKADSGCRIVEIEAARHNGVYAGTPDRVIDWLSFSTVIDIKTGAPVPAYGVQLAGYAELCRLPTEGCRPRYTVLLKNDGRYKVHPCDDPVDHDVFRAALALYQWKQNNGVRHE
jgi:hypothetical protein